MRHPLLPDTYVDSAMHRSLLQALKPYVLTDKDDVINPEIKWNLRKAISNAAPLLNSAIWKYDGRQTEHTVDTGWEMAADSDKETDAVYTIIAAIVAEQILDPDSGFAIRRIEYRRGGEVALIISTAVQQKIKERYPDAQYLGYNIPDESKKDIFSLRKIIKRFFKY